MAANAASRIFQRRLRRKPPPKPIKHPKILTYDTVYINTGPDKGKVGKVIKVDRKKNRVFVEGAHMVKKHQKGNAYRKGGIFLMESSIHYSNVNLVDPFANNKRCRVRWVKQPDGKWGRVSSKTGQVIPKPEQAAKERRATRNPFNKDTDTPTDVVLANTYEIQLRREAEILKEIAEQEDAGDSGAAPAQSAGDSGAKSPEDTKGVDPATKDEPDDKSKGGLFKFW